MDITCPACRKVNESPVQCGRCGADLKPLLEIRRHADLAIQKGTQYLKRKDGRNALQQAQLAWHLKHSPKAARLAFFACLMLEQYPVATRWYQVLHASESKRQ